MEMTYYIVPYYGFCEIQILLPSLLPMMKICFTFALTRKMNMIQIIIIIHNFLLLKNFPWFLKGMLGLQQVILMSSR